uniref:Putative radical SAM superfamily protein n=1 Tax=viral metagenome TaxID=1070528 RepID=A0A6M3INT4_9ZZZZ
MLRENYCTADTFPGKLLHAMLRRPLRPLHVRIYPTNRCNGSCSWCSYGNRDVRDELPVADVLAILGRLRGLGTGAVTFAGGGEPTVHPGIVTMIERAAAYDMAVGLVTNGIRVGHLSDVAELISWVRVSARGADEVARVAALGARRAGVSFVYSSAGDDAALRDVLSASVDDDRISHVQIVQNIFDRNLSMDYPLSVARTSPKIFVRQTRERQAWRGTCWSSLVRPVIGADGYVYPCCSAQHSMDDDRKRLSEDMRMCWWEDFAADEPYEARCRNCFYTPYNRVLGAAMAEYADPEFI